MYFICIFVLTMCLVFVPLENFLMLLYCLYFCSGQLALYINKFHLERARNGQDWTTRLSPSLSAEKLCFRTVRPSFRLCVHHESLRTSFINHLGYFHQIYYFCTLDFDCMYFLYSRSLRLTWSICNNKKIIKRRA